MTVKAWREPGRIAVFLLAATCAFADAPVDAIVAATQRSATFPDVADETDAAAAYAIQTAVVERTYGAAIAGYKAGLTSAAAQQRFGVAEPVLGALPAAGRMEPGAHLAAVPGLQIEVEIGFLIGRGDAPAAMFPAIELPRLDYADMAKVTLADVVATNVAAYRFIVGPSAMLDPDVRRLEVSLERDGRRIFTAFASDAMGDPTDVYEWLIPRIHSHGYSLQPGMVVITGSLGRVVDAEPGKYVAHYGALGDIQFTIEGGGHALQAPRQ